MFFNIRFGNGLFYKGAEKQQSKVRMLAAILSLSILLVICALHGYTVIVNKSLKLPFPQPGSCMLNVDQGWINNTTYCTGSDSVCSV